MFKMTGYELGDRDSIPGKHRDYSLVHTVQIGSWFYSLYVKKFLEEFYLIVARA
jgi:hypothetical protein